MPTNRTAFQQLLARYDDLGSGLLSAWDGIQIRVVLRGQVERFGVAAFAVAIVKSRRPADQAGGEGRSGG